MSNRGIKLKASNNKLSQSSSNSASDGSVEQEEVVAPPPQAPKGRNKNGRNNGRGESPVSSEENSKSEEGGESRKRKSDDSNDSDARAGKNRKTVTFSQESGDSDRKGIKQKPNSKKAKAHNTRIGTRSTRGSGEAVLLPELPVRKKKLYKVKKVKKSENCTVVKMLTGTLYLYRGERPRAEFVRTK